MNPFKKVPVKVTKHYKTYLKKGTVIRSFSLPSIGSIPKSVSYVGTDKDGAFVTYVTYRKPKKPEFVLYSAILHDIRRFYPSQSYILRHASQTLYNLGHMMRSDDMRIRGSDSNITVSDVSIESEETTTCTPPSDTAIKTPQQKPIQCSYQARECCPICLGYNIEKLARTDVCMHIFHQSCLEEWTEKCKANPTTYWWYPEGTRSRPYAGRPRLVSFSRPPCPICKLEYTEVYVEPDRVKQPEITEQQKLNEDGKKALQIRLPPWTSQIPASEFTGKLKLNEYGKRALAIKGTQYQLQMSKTNHMKSYLYSEQHFNSYQ